MTEAEHFAPITSAPADGLPKSTEAESACVPPDKPGNSANSAANELPLARLIAKSERVEWNLAALRELVDKRLSYDKTKEDAFDRLYSELEDLKKNSALEHLRPLFIDFILLYDRIESIRQSLEQGEPAAPAAAALVRTLGEELVEILCRREVELIVPLSDAFDPTVHRAIGVEAVSSDAQSNRVTKVVRRGFRMGNRILRPEEVIVSKNPAKQ